MAAVGERFMTHEYVDRNHLKDSVLSWAEEWLEQTTYISSKR